MPKLQFLLTLIILLSLNPLSVGAVTQSQPDCNPFKSIEICIKDVTFSETSIEDGESLTVTVTVQNVGNETGDAVLIVGTEQPNGEYTFGSPRKIEHVEPGEVQEVPFTGPVKNQGPLGKHRLNFMLFDDSQQHLYDATGYYKTLIIEKKSFDINLIEWLQGLHYTIQITLGIFALLAAFLGGKAL